MKALLDTHAFLWWNADAPQLSITAKAFIRDSRNEVFLSAVSAWEIAIKFSKGRLELPETPDRYVASRLSDNGFSPLPIQLSHAFEIFKLPDIHRDPFDRLLVVQSQLEGLPLLTADQELRQYDIDIIW